MVISTSPHFGDEQGFSIVVLYHTVTIKNTGTYIHVSTLNVHPPQQSEKFN